jgi:hypothetical protein
MQKGISYTIATLMIVLIAVGLSMTFYYYSDRLVGRTLSKSVEFLDVACSPSTGSYLITLRNTALFDELPTKEILINLDGEPTAGRVSWDSDVIPAKGGIGVGMISGISTGNHRIKIVSPVSQPQELAVAC